MPKWLAGVMVFGMLSIAYTGCYAADPTPYLQVETGVHQATINRLAFIPLGNKVVSVSDDKTARVWSGDTLKPLGVIRPPIGPSDDGALDAVAATGNILAVAGRIRYGDAFAVQFYRVSDFKLIGHRSELPAPVSALAFGSGGHDLVVGMVANRGIAFYDMTDGTQVAADPEYSGQVQWIDATADGRTVASGQDGKVRLYGPDHRKLVEVGLPHADHPYAVAFAPDGRLIAVGVQNSPRVWLLDARTLRVVGSLSGISGRLGGFATVAFAPDGNGIFAAGTYKSGLNTPRLVRHWDLRTGQATEFAAGSDSVTDVLPVGGDLLLSDAEPLLARFSSAGLPLALRQTRHIDFRDAGLSGFAVSADGNVIELPPLDGQRVVAFDVRSRSLLSNIAGLALVQPQTSAPGLEATSWRNTMTPRLNGQPLALEAGETALAAAVSADGKGTAFGTNFYVRYQRRDGTSWKAVAPASSWAVNVSGDGTRVIAGMADGSVRWFDAVNGNLLLTLFVEPGSHHWVLSTPEGFFDHDDAEPPDQIDGRSLIGYRFNDPSAQISRFVAVGQLYPIYYRPDLVGLALNPDPAAGATIRQAQFRRGAVETVLMRGLPAQLEVLQACGTSATTAEASCPVGDGIGSLMPSSPSGAQLQTAEPAVLVRFRLTNRSGQPGSAVIYHNDAKYAPALLTLSEDIHSRTQAAIIPLDNGVNTIRLLPVSANAEIEGSDRDAVSFQVANPGAAAIARLRRRKLYVLTIGITDYGPPYEKLPNARNDALAVADLMQTPDPPVYDKAIVTRLDDAQATESQITKALEDIARRARPADLVLVFFAGHGENIDGHYYFAPADFATRSPDLLRSLQDRTANVRGTLDQIYHNEGLGHDKLISLLQAIKASRVAIILDTCYSGSLATQDTVAQHNLNTTMANTLSHATGRFVLSSATTTAEDAGADRPGAAYNSKNHGLFTGYLLDALEGRGETHPDNIDVYELAKYTVTMVKKMTAGTDHLQEPVYYFSGNDFFALRSGARGAAPQPAQPPVTITGR